VRLAAASSGFDSQHELLAQAVDSSVQPAPQGLGIEHETS
jgi:hypothetical protein